MIQKKKQQHIFIYPETSHKYIFVDGLYDSNYYSDAYSQQLLTATKSTYQNIPINQSYWIF